MWEFTVYSLKAGACLAVFYLFFKLALSRETLHRFNRVLILAAMALSFALPLCVITVERELPGLPAAVSAAVPATTEGAAAGPEAGSFPWKRLGGTLFAAGIAITLGATMRSLWQVQRIIRRGHHERLEGGATLVRMEEPVSPFSWGRWIVVSERDLAESGREILTHERAHQRFGHTWDLLATDLVGAVQWFNPAMWLLRRELRAIHEYEADAEVLRSGADAREYQLLLIKKAVGGRWYSVANSLNHSNLKNRITMMLQKRSSRWTGARALLVLPLAGLALGSFARTVYVLPEDKVKKESATIQISGEGISSSGVDQRSLVLVDGRETDYREFRNILPQKIASVQVMKGDEAVAEYGDKARAGVIVVTTKDAAAENGDPLRTAGRVIRIRKSGGTAEAVTEDAAAAAEYFKSDEWKQAQKAMKEAKTICISNDGPSAGTTWITTTTDSNGRATTEKSSLPVSGKHISMSNSVSNDDGKEESSQTVHISGNVSITGTDEIGDLLVLIDGKKSTAKRLKKLDSEKIDHITILKGAAAVAAYGEEASGGAFVVTTKKQDRKR